MDEKLCGRSHTEFPVTSIRHNRGVLSLAPKVDSLPVDRDVLVAADRQVVDSADIPPAPWERSIGWVQINIPF